MCGFAGEIRQDGSVERAALEAMGATLGARGPDGQGLWTSESVGLTHRRLKVIDPSEAGAQPMIDEKLRLALVFNGCIYNYRELRAELGREGYEFFSQSDSEVVIKAYHRWGDRFVDHLLGMFAIALVETDSGRLVLARDRLGIKPLYLTDVDDALRFASTTQALLAGGRVDTSIDSVALHHYLTWHSVVPAPRTILSGVRKLGAGMLLVVEPDGRRHEDRFWAPSFTRGAAPASLSGEDWEDAVLEGVKRAVERRMVADVPVGVLLSGGLDSSMIVALLAEAGQRGLQTFSIGFEGVGDREGDEFHYSDLVAEMFDTEHHKIQVPGDRLLPALQPAIAAMSEPMVSHDAVAFFLLAEQVSKQVKVVQSGQGADEVFAGYHWYQPVADSNGSGFVTYADVFFDRSHAEITATVAAGRVPLRDPSTEFAARHFHASGADEAVDRALRLDTEVMLIEDPVKRVDNMTMAWGLEARVPFLDHELVELAAACPPDLKLSQDGKGVLKDVGRRLLPDEIVDRPKGYFPVPGLSTLEGDLLDFLREVLLSERAEQRGLFRPDAVREMFDSPNEHVTSLDSNKLWQLGVLEIWLETVGL